MKLAGCIALVALSATTARADFDAVPSVAHPELATVPAPSPLAPIPPPIVAPMLPPRGHFRVARLHRDELVAGLVVGGVSWTLTAAIGLGVHDYLLCVPGGGPLLGLIYEPRGTANPVGGEFSGVLWFMLGMADVLMQSGAGPLLTIIGVTPHLVWQPQ